MYSNWKDDTGELKHAGCSYHKASAEFMRIFVVTMDNKASRVDLMLDKTAKETESFYDLYSAV